MMVFLFMLGLPLIYTLNYTLCPYTTLVRASSRSWGCSPARRGARTRTPRLATTSTWRARWPAGPAYPPPMNSPSAGKGHGRDRRRRHRPLHRAPRHRSAPRHPPRDPHRTGDRTGRSDITCQRRTLIMNPRSGTAWGRRAGRLLLAGQFVYGGYLAARDPRARPAPPDRARMPGAAPLFRLTAPAIRLARLALRHSCSPPLYTM